MDNLSNELSKLKIDKTKRAEVRPRGGKKFLIVALILAGAALGALVLLRRPSAAAIVETVRPRLESSSQSAVLVATGYVIAHHKIQVGSKIAGRVAWIGSTGIGRLLPGGIACGASSRAVVIEPRPPLSGPAGCGPGPPGGRA